MSRTGRWEDLTLRRLVLGPTNWLYSGLAEGHLGKIPGWKAVVVSSSMAGPIVIFLKRLHGYTLPSYSGPVGARQVHGHPFIVMAGLLRTRNSRIGKKNFSKHLKFPISSISRAKWWYNGVFNAILSL